MTPAAPACPLCHDAGEKAVNPAHGRDYHACGICDLVFMQPDQRPDAETERARYDTHRNDVADPGYRAFLRRLMDPLVERLRPGAEGLDYGSGPGPALSIMLGEAGFPTAVYDPFYAPDRAPLARTWDFITCTETAEHFFEPAAEFERLDSLLRPGGILALMTTMRDDSCPLDEWWYVRDFTHVCFYSARTMIWIARRHGWGLERPHANVALFRKAAGASAS